MKGEERKKEKKKEQQLYTENQETGGHQRWRQVRCEECGWGTTPAASHLTATRLAGLIYGAQWET